jgi:hypothetical protein
MGVPAVNWRDLQVEGNRHGVTRLLCHPPSPPQVRHGFPYPDPKPSPIVEPVIVHHKVSLRGLKAVSESH